MPCLFTLLLAYSEKKVLIFIKSHISIFFLCSWYFVFSSENFVYPQVMKTFFYLLSRRNFIILSFIFRSDSSGIDYCVWVKQGSMFIFSPYGFTIDPAKLIQKTMLYPLYCSGTFVKPSIIHTWVFLDCIVLAEHVAADSV